MEHTAHVVPDPSRTDQKGPRQRVVLLVLALVMLQVIWPLTMDLYLPSLPTIRRDFGSPESGVQLTLTAAFIGMGIGQLASGPVSDAVGRARPLSVMIVVYCLATASCALAPDLGWLIVSRAFQGVGSAACAVIALAIVRDLYAGKQLLVFLARLAIASGVFVVISPALGAQLLQVVGWRGLFWILLLYGLVLLCIAGVILLRNETHTADRRLLRKGWCGFLEASSRWAAKMRKCARTASGLPPKPRRLPTPCAASRPPSPKRASPPPRHRPCCLT